MEQNMHLVVFHFFEVMVQEVSHVTWDQKFGRSVWFLEIFILVIFLHSCIILVKSTIVKILNGGKHKLQLHKLTSKGSRVCLLLVEIVSVDVVEIVFNGLCFIFSFVNYGLLNFFHVFSLDLFLLSDHSIVPPLIFSLLLRPQPFLVLFSLFNFSLIFIL
jgi:hypothetical protein